jgi:uncharacterized protein YukE
MRGNVSELLGANTDVLDRSAESLSTDARRLADIRIMAQRVLGELQASWSGSDLMRLTQQWEQQASPLLAGACASLDTCAAQLRVQSAAQRLTSSSGPGSSGLVPAGMTPMPGAPPSSPPMHGSPADNASWWKSLSVLQQQRVLREHPGWIGNRDGVDFSSRDLANRALLTGDRDRLVTDMERLEDALAGSWSDGALTNEDAALDQVKEKLASIGVIEETLAKPGERQLLLLDLGEERAQAAIANGNVETADNVAVFVPGLGTTVAGTLAGSDKEMTQLKQRSESESRRAHPDHVTTTATVSWIGYQAPQKGLDLLNPFKSVAADGLAKDGAAQLVPFLRGIDAARDHDAHLTLLGHSYGSTTAGLALQQDTGVDDVVFFGSPGLGTDHLEDLKVASGHVNYIEARRDVVGDAGHFGIDPSHMSGMDHPSARESTVVDPATGEVRHFSEVTGHSSYLLDDSTSQYNMSVVVAGVPDRRVHDPGKGFGDVLTWRLPGTY